LKHVDLLVGPAAVARHRPSRRRSRIASLFRATSSCDHNSNAHFIDRRSPSRKSGFTSFSKLIGSKLTDNFAPLFDSRARNTKVTDCAEQIPI